MVKGMKILVICCCSFMLSCCLFVLLTTDTTYAAGTNYYVDDINGNNTYEGTSEQTAWKTLAKVNGTTFQPGDHILFKSGGSWSGQLHPLGSGTDGSPIIIDQYGTGNKPIINGGGILNTGAVFLYNQQYWEINNLEITNKGTASGQKMGISIEAKDIGTLNHIYMKNLVIHDVNGLQTDKQNGGIWVHTYGNQVQSKFNDIQIMNNTVYDTDRAGIVVTSDWWCNPDLVTCGTTRPAYYPSTKVVVSNNYVYSVGGDGISIRDTASPIVEYNVVHDANARSGDYNNAIWTYNATNAKIQYNEAYLTRTTKDGLGLGVDYLQDGAILQYNYTHDNEGGAVGIYTDGTWAPQSNRNFKIRYNISQNDGAAIYNFFGSAVNGEIYNNTVYVKGDSSPAIYKFNNWGGYASNISSKNNLFYNLGNGNYEWGQSSNLTWDHNIFYGFHPANEPTDANKITSDPLLVNPGSGANGIHTVDGYKLLYGSPALAGGTVVANHGGQDYWGNLVSTTTSPNIGAYNGAGVSLSGVDLQVSALSVQEASFSTGDPIHFQLTVRNNGTIATGSQTITNQFMVDGQLVKNESFSIDLGPGQSVTWTSSAWNATKSGFLLKAVTDASNQIAEVQENNNTISQYINLIVGKDLVPVSLSVQEPNWGIGSTIHFVMNVKNQGNVPINNEWFGARFYIDGAAVEADWAGTPDAFTLNPGETITLIAKKGWVVDRNQLSLRGVADTWGAVHEVNESNNESTVSLTSPGGFIPTYDLVITKLEVAERDFKEGEKIHFVATVKNQGSTQTPTQWLGTNLKINGTRVDWAGSTTQMAAGETRTFTSQGWIADSEQLTVTGFVDNQNLISESDETNNERTDTLNAITNMIANPGFEESSSTAWTAWGGGSLSATGGNIAPSAGKTGWLGGVSQYVAGLKSGEEYELNAWVKTTSGNSVTIGAKDFGGTTVKQNVYDTNYTLKTLRFTPLNGWTGASIYLYADTTATSYMDDVQLVRIPKYPNLAVNSGFENGTNGWSGWGSYQIVATNAIGGTHSCKISWTGACEQTITGLKPNTMYTLTGWGKVTSGDMGYIGVKNYGGVEKKAAVTGNTYTGQTISFTTGSSNTSALIYIYNNAGTTYGEDFYVSEFH
ncbi:CARDB domain-containing protein [Paenibacillus qinlingensis]|uniref:CARDB domain-containing protein n=1 Tax=Paenibacillus qinlingensis TaxID=1837343 RepID=UPI001563040F|nr:CARDB domain-containing protein [Paenibacillus qinlingensis]